MAKILKQSTAVVISFGPFVDKTDGNTYETALAGTGANQLENTTTGIRISKNGGALAARHAAATASTYDALGMYLVTLDTTDTGTVGLLRVAMNNNDALTVWDDFIVLPANVYDSLMGTDLLDVNAAQWLGTAILAPGTAGTPDVNAKLIGATAQTGNDAGADLNAIVAKLPTNYIMGSSVQTDKDDEIDAILADTGTDGVVVAAASKTGYALSAAGVQAIWDALTSALTTVGSIGKKLADWAVGTIDTYTGNTKQTGDAYARLGAPAGASVSVDVAAVKSDSGAIKAKTDNLPSDPADESLLLAAIATRSSHSAADVWDVAMADHQTADKFGQLQCLLGKWVIENNQLKLYDISGNLRFTFNLTQDGSATEFNPDAREPA